jgi:sentrin-specific protease 7
MFDVAMEQASGQSSPDCVLAEGETVPQTSVVVEIPQRASSRNAQPQTRGKLKDRMLRADHTSKLDSPETPKAIPVQPTGRYETRRTRRSSPKPTVNHMSPDPDGWTLKNPDWKSRWHQSLVYPATGKNRATVDAEDINRLDEGEYLNDNIISFYLRYLQVKLEEQRPEILKKVYIFNSFFFEKLKDPKTRYEGVRTWTAKVDLLSYDYIVVPVNEHAHWYLAIICNVARALPAHDSRDEKEEAEYSTTVKERVSSSPKVALVDERKSISLDEEPPAPPSAITGDQNATLSSPSRPSSNSQNNLAKWKPRRSIGGPGRRFDPSEPRIITLDSLGGSHSVACKVLKDYLAEEARDKKGVELALIPSGMTGKGIPEQDNFCDCGVFILGYMEEFLKNPDEASRRLLQKEPLEWDIKPSQLRSNIRDLLFTLQQEQQERLRKEREEKRRAKRLWAASNSQLASPSPGNIVSSKPSQEPPSRQSLARSQRSSPSAGLTSKQPSEIMEGSETLDAPPVSGSAERLQACPQSQSSVFDGTEPRLISRLVDDENPSGKDGQSTDSFYSARSTPGGEDHKVRQHRTIESKSPKGRFVERIPSSGSEDNNPQRKPRMPIRETIEVDDDDDDDIMPTRAPKNPSLRQSSSPLVAAPSPKWPSYDGIYRCPSRD